MSALLSGTHLPHLALLGQISITVQYSGEHPQRGVSRLALVILHAEQPPNHQLNALNLKRRSNRTDTSDKARDIYLELGERKQRFIKVMKRCALGLERRCEIITTSTAICVSSSRRDTENAENPKQYQPIASATGIVCLFWVIYNL